MDAKSVSLIGYLPEEIFSELALDKPFRARQIFKWIYSGVQSFSEMTDLSKDLRALLEQKAVLYTTKIKQKLHDPDGTVKLQIELSDGNFIETVLLVDAEERKTACVSCQAGCAMACKFCKTGTLGFSRNLTAGEIIEQFLHLEHIAGKLDNIVFMGMGEPMLNLDSIRKTVAVLSDKAGRNLSKRRITLSTSGIIKGIYDLADNGPALRLAVSLTTADEDLRQELMPVTNANPLSELRKAIQYYTEKTSIRCTLEAALMHNTNTSENSARQFVDFAKGLNVHYNLVPWNKVENLPFTEPTVAEVKKLVNVLERSGISTTVRTKRGSNIGGACGQLGKVDSANQM